MPLLIMWKFILQLFGFNAPKVKLPTRRYIEDVKPGQYIKIEWYRIRHGIGFLKCVNNDPATKRILLQVQWNNYLEIGCYQYEEIVLKYSSDELANFNLLNPLNNIEDDEEIDDYDISGLQKKLNAALEREDYETAEEMQRKIDKILKK